MPFMSDEMSSFFYLEAEAPHGNLNSHRDYGFLQAVFLNDSTNLALWAFTKTFQTVAEALGTIPKVQENKTTGVVHAVSIKGGWFEKTKVGKLSDPLLEGNYSPEVVKTYQYTRSEFKKDNPRGRLVLISGPWGTGKTRLLSSMISEVSSSDGIQSLLVPSSLLEKLNSPEFTNFMVTCASQKNGGRTIIYVEDADLALKKRSEDSPPNPALESLLNLTDGIYGRLVDLIVVCTTNLTEDEIDGAVLRNGRKLSSIYVGPISLEQAREIFKRETGSDPKEDAIELTSQNQTTLANVYAAVVSHRESEGGAQ